MDYGSQAPINIKTVATAVQRRWACHTRTVLPAGAYCRQRCIVVVVYLWYMSWAVCSREGNKTDKIIPVRTYKRNRLIHSPRKKTFEHTPREVQCSDRPQTSTTGSGRLFCVDVLSVLAKSTRTKRYDRKQTTNSQIYVYIHGSPSGSGVNPGGRRYMACRKGP